MYNYNKNQSPYVSIQCIGYNDVYLQQNSGVINLCSKWPRNAESYSLLVALKLWF